LILTVLKLKKDALRWLTIIAGSMLLIIPSSVWGAERIVEVLLDGNHLDSNDRYIAQNASYGSFVTGFSGQAFRSSHSGDDGSGSSDFTLHFSDGNYWPATNELYIRYYYRFESQYTNISSNVKWLWTYGSESHNEIICSDVTSNTVSMRWQLSGGGAGWPSGVTKYGSASVQKGTWMKVEIYFRLSSGSNNLNADGLQWIKINDQNVIYQTNVRTGKPGRMHCPAINATSNQPSGQGWWQIDNLEIWDGIPGDQSSNPIPDPEPDPVNISAPQMLRVVQASNRISIIH
jgi:hypothetical protein